MRIACAMLGWAAGLLLGLGSAGCGKKADEPGKGSPSPTLLADGKDALKPKEAGKDDKVDSPPDGKASALAAADLIKQFRADWPGTDKKYDGTVVEVEGFVDSVNRTVTFGDLIVRGGADRGDFLSGTIRCEIGPALYAKAASTLSEGQKVKVKGVYKPSGLNVTVLLTKAEYAELSPSTLKTFTSVELGQRGEKDRVGLGKELGGTEFIATGKIIKLEEEGAFPMVELESGGKTRVRGRMLSKDEWATLKTGQEVRVRGAWSFIAPENEVQIDNAFTLPAK